MVTLRELAAHAADLEVAGALDEAVEVAIARATGLQLKSRFAGKLWLPKDESLMWIGTAAQQAESILPTQGSALISALLHKPYRVYELAAPPSRRTLALVGSYRRRESRDLYVAVGRLHAVLESKKKVASSGPFELALIPLADTISTRRVLEDLARDLSVTEWTNLKGKSVSIVVGGSGTLPTPGWQRQVGCVLWSFGYRIGQVFEEPWRREASVNSRLSRREADLYIFLREWNIDAGGNDYTDRLMEMVSGKLVIDTEDVDSLPEALDLIRLYLADEAIDVPDLPKYGEDEASLTEPPSVPKTWQEFSDGLDSLVCDMFVITDRARNGCQQCDYPDPSKMWEQLSQLRRAAIAWVEAGCSIGAAFDAWIKAEYKLNVAMGDDAIVKAKLDKFTHEGRELSRLPHVQLDQAKAFTEIGRIHFALDTDGKRIIVDHIGLKLLGRKAAT